MGTFRDYNQSTLRGDGIVRTLWRHREISRNVLSLDNKICVCYDYGMDKEMVGFILADGCFMILKQTRRRKYKDKIYTFVNYVPRVNVSQREDNLQVLKQFQDKFGGYVYENRSINRKSRIFYWQVQNRKSCKKIAKMVIKAKLKHKKRKAAKICYEFCREKDVKKYPDYRDKIRKANTFQE